MKSVYYVLKDPITHHFKKDILKEGVKAVSNLTQKMRTVEIEDKVDISSHLYNQQIFKPEYYFFILSGLITSNNGTIVKK